MVKAHGHKGFLLFVLFSRDDAKGFFENNRGNTGSVESFVLLH